MSLPQSPRLRGPDSHRGDADESPSAVVGTTWPAVTYERLPWTAARAAGVASRRDRAAQRPTYEAAVPARIATLDFVAPTAVAAELDDATAEVARFDAEMGAEIAPFSSVLLRSESAASSRIENLTASARSIAMAELGDTSRENARLVAANTASMRSAISLADRLDADAILRMHLALLGESDPGGAGKWREEQVWVGGPDLGPGGADFVPPHHSRISGCIDDLVAYLAREDVPVLSQAAIAHAQFETIHPFTDGNGRTGRALLQAMLRGKGLTRNVTMPISAGLLARTREYFAALGAYRDGDPVPIVSVTAQASFAAVDNGQRLVADLRAIRASWRERVTVRAGARTWDVVGLLLRQPVVNARVLHEELGLAPGHVRRHMDPLTEAGVVIPTAQYRRGVSWRAQEVLDALDAFAERAGRRRRG